MLTGLGESLTREVMMQFEGEPATSVVLEKMSEALSRRFFERTGLTPSFHVDIDEDGTASIMPLDPVAVLLVCGKENDAVFSERFSKVIAGATLVDHPELPYTVVIFTEGNKPKIKRIAR